MVKIVATAAARPIPHARARSKTIIPAPKVRLFGDSGNTAFDFTQGLQIPLFEILNVLSNQLIDEYRENIFEIFFLLSLHCHPILSLEKNAGWGKIMQQNGDNSRPSRRKLLGGTVAIATVSGIAAVASRSISGTTTYKYDDLGRLVQVTTPSSRKTSYTYDKADNRIQVATTSSSSSSSSSGPTVINVTAASNLRTLANNAGYTGTAGANYQFVVASGVTIMGAAGAGKGIDTGTWPSGSSISLVISGNVYGGGGNGGAGNNSGSGYAGGGGGDAIYVQAPISITVNAGASIKSGGGGGGGGSSQSFTGMGGGTVGGDGGGGGFPNGLGGAGTTGTYADPVAPGSPGTTSGGGAGGAGGPLGGNGGGAGSAGSAGSTSTNPGGAGGAAGYAIRKNSQTVTFTNNGTVTGTVA
jgi:YD repeat-containing protein